MADRILTFSGKTISGPSGTGIVVVKEPEPVHGVTIGSRTYRTVTIGSQEWLAENLDYKFQYNGGTIPVGSSGLPTTPAAWYYNNDESTYGIDGVRKCGLLYNWYAVKHLNDNRSIICPGWHVPTNDEWTALANAVGGISTAGTKLKAANVSWAPTWDGTDDYGFGVLPAGIRWTSDSFYDLGSNALFWTANEYSADYAYYCHFDTNASMYSGYDTKGYACSVRLVKDSAST